MEKLGHMIEVLDAALLIAAERLWHQNPEGHDSPDSLFRDLIKEAKEEIILAAVFPPRLKASDVHY